MSDTSVNVARQAGPKPRISLLSSKQAGIRLRSEDHPEFRPDFLTPSTNDEPRNEVKESSERARLELIYETALMEPCLNGGFQNLDGNTRDGNRDLSVSKADLIKYISLLKSDLKLRDNAIAALRLRQLKILLNPIEISRSSLAKAYIELQERVKQKDPNNNSKDSNITGATSNTDDADKVSSETPSSASKESNHGSGETESSTKQPAHKDEEAQSDGDSLNILNTLLELLDRHPLLALPRDSVYFFDDTCDELSTKNYLVLKNKHLTKLIEQHRHYRYFMHECLRRSEERYYNLLQEYEREKGSKLAEENSTYNATGRTILLKHINQLKEIIEKGKNETQAIVTTLLNDLKEERQRSETLARKLKTIESNSEERILREKEQVEADMMKFKKQFERKAINLQEDAIKMRAEIEQQRQTIADLTKELNKKGCNETITQSSSTTSSSPNRPGASPKQISIANNNKQTTNQSSASAARNSINSTGTKAPIPPKPTLNSSSVLGSGKSNSSAQPTPAARTTTTNINSASNQRVGQSYTNIQSSGEALMRVQFKSASVLSTNQQVRSPKPMSVGSNSTIRFTRSVSSSQAPPATKPQVPAKPAQLLDQQRNSLS